MGLVALSHVGSSQIRHQTCVLCVGRQIVNPWTAWEIRMWVLLQWERRGWEDSAVGVLAGPRSLRRLWGNLTFSSTGRTPGL